MKKYTLKQDIVIKKGTECECIDGVKKEFYDGNYEALIPMGDDATISLLINDDAIEFIESKED